MNTFLNVPQKLLKGGCNYLTRSKTVKKPDIRLKMTNRFDKEIVLEQLRPLLGDFILDNSKSLIHSFIICSDVLWRLFNFSKNVYPWPKLVACVRSFAT